ncbi:MAG: hypothetical protein QOH13_2034 [Thermoleophilaceae bacterium]|nr:hypothetical protein [Thermoleophilaceae bacterium]
MAAAESVPRAVVRVRRRRGWLVATVAATVAPIAFAVVTAPPGSAPAGAALTWVLFVGSSVHVASTAWFYCVPEVRKHMVAHQGRYLLAPAFLVLGCVVTASVVPERRTTWLLLAFFGWQFVHFQKQNLGLAALAARSHGAGSLTVWERRALIVAGIGGVLALLGHPDLLQVAGAHRTSALFAAGGVLFASGVLGGAWAASRRRSGRRPAQFVAVYAVSLIFFLPVFLFASPYAAVAGLTIAHGLQYLLIMGLVAAGPAKVDSSVLVLVNIALLLGLGLNRMSHLHGASAAGRALYGLFLGLSVSHFVIDAGLWRLRDEFPRAFLTRRLPYLLAPAQL